MNEREIAELAAWTAKSIREAITEENRELDDAGEDIIREYIQTCLRKKERGDKITLETCAQLVTEIFTRRRNETKTDLETFNAMMIFGAKFPSFVDQNRRERDAESARLAEELPAVKV